MYDIQALRARGGGCGHECNLSKVEDNVPQTQID